MKPFNLEQAKQGKPVVTRDGRPVRILAFDRKGCYPIIGLISRDKEEDCEALEHSANSIRYIATVKVEWEE